MAHLKRVFVYGTLKKGEPNHSWLTREENGFAKFLGAGYTVAKYPLVIASRYNIPFLVDKPGQGNNVEGEVYEVDDKMVSNLDILEDHPNYYVRRLEPIKLNNETVQCWTYFLTKFQDGLLKKEMLTVYNTKGPHNLPYCERYLRDPTFDHKTEVLRE